MNERLIINPDERVRILRMVEDGKISASEGVALLDALGKSRSAPAPAVQPVGVALAAQEPPLPETPAPAGFEADEPDFADEVSSGGAAYSSPASSSAGGNGSGQGLPKWFRVRVTDLSSGRSKVTVNIPLTLMDWGMRIGAQFAPEIRQYNLEGMMRALREEGSQGKIIDVVDDEDGEHVEIYIE